MQEIQRLTPRQREDHQVSKYRALITIATEVIRTGREVATAALALLTRRAARRRRAA